MKINDILKKVLVWRCISILVTLFVLYVTTGDFGSATGTTFLLHAILITSHYFFEKCWSSLYEKR